MVKYCGYVRICKHKYCEGYRDAQRDIFDKLVELKWI